MAIVRVKGSDIKFSEEYIAQRSAALKDRPVDCSDIPEYTHEQLVKMRIAAIEKRKKQMYSMRLPAETIRWWQSLGRGYTGIMVKLLEEAPRHPEWIEECLNPLPDKTPLPSE